jgi:leucyl aminopeptidase
MRYSILLPLYAATLVAAISQPKGAQIVLQHPEPTLEEPDEYLIELSPGKTKLVTEDEKWALRRVSIGQYTLLASFLIVPERGQFL